MLLTKISMSRAVLSFGSKVITIRMYSVRRRYLEEVELVDFLEVQLVELLPEHALRLLSLDEGVAEVVEPHDVGLLALQHRFIAEIRL